MCRQVTQRLQISVAVYAKQCLNPDLILPTYVAPKLKDLSLPLHILHIYHKVKVYLQERRGTKELLWHGNLRLFLNRELVLINSPGSKYKNSQRAKLRIFVMDSAAIVELFYALFTEKVINMHISLMLAVHML